MTGATGNPLWDEILKGERERSADSSSSEAPSPPCRALQAIAVERGGFFHLVTPTRDIYAAGYRVIRTHTESFPLTCEGAVLLLSFFFFGEDALHINLAVIE